MVLDTLLYPAALKLFCEGDFVSLNLYNLGVKSFNTFTGCEKVRLALRGKDGGRLRDLVYMVGFTHTSKIGYVFNP